MDETDERTEHARRCRAARAWAGLSQVELAEALEALGHKVAVATIKRTEAGLRKVPADELLRVGEACKVPPWFMTRGISQGEANPLMSAVLAIDDRVNALARDVEHVDACCTGLAAKVETIIESLAEAFEHARDADTPPPESTS